MVSSADGLEPLFGVVLVGEMLRKNLDRDRSFKPGVAGAVDFAHAPGAQRRNDFVRAEFCTS